MNVLIWNACLSLLKLNARLYGNGSSHELCRDLRGMFPVSAPDSPLSPKVMTVLTALGTGALGLLAIFAFAKALMP